jgi:hypothetical protein
VFQLDYASMLLARYSLSIAEFLRMIVLHSFRPLPFPALRQLLAGGSEGHHPNF